jgi:steroid delta-isomerase-like uncharacterized protein
MRLPSGIVAAKAGYSYITTRHVNTMRGVRARATAAFAAALLGCGGATPAPTVPDAAVEVRPEDVQRWLDAWNSHDLDRIAALFTPDAVVHQPQNPEPLTTASMKPFFAMVFRCFPDVHFEPTGVALGRGEAASWELVTGTMLAPMTDPATGRTFAPTGRKFSHIAAMRLVYAPDHRIREFWTIWDRATLMTQLGLTAALERGGVGQAAAGRQSGEAITHEDVDRWAAAWNSHDIDTVAALFTPDIAIDQPENGKPLDAKSLRSFFGMIFKAYPDFHVVVQQAIVDGTTAVSVERVTGTWSGAFVNPTTGVSVPGNGRTFDHPGVMVIEYASDHRIRHVSIYWDQLTVDHQLGIKPQ